MGVKKLQNLSPYEYEHIFDARALNALQHTAGIDALIRKFNKYAIEKMVTIQYTGSNVHVTKDNYGEIFTILEETCETINLPQLPDLYINWSYNINGFTIGVDHPIIVLTSGAIDLLSQDELRYLVGHEVGHIKSRHTLYHQVGQFMPMIGDIIGTATMGIGKILSTPLQLALLQWCRMSEFTADRAGLLSCQDIDIAASVMMKWAGTPIKYHDKINTKTFLDQAERFRDLDYDNLNKIIKFFSILDDTHPWTVMRTAELVNWIKNGEYNAVLNRDRKFSMKIIKCESCGSALEEGDKFCRSCGASS